MFHGLTNQFLYSAYKITTTFIDDVGNSKGGIGTCFFVPNAKGELCLVTNRHVLDINFRATSNEFSNYSLQKVQIAGKFGRSGDNFPEADIVFTVPPLVKFAEDDKNDIACIYPLIGFDPSIRLDYFIPYSLLATNEDFQQKLEVCDFLAFPGFPEWHDKKSNRPILRTGTISSDPRFDYSYGSSVGGACVAYEAFSYGGSSGSPVFAVQKGPKPGLGIVFADFRDVLLVGINAGHLKTSDKMHSGISYLYKSTAILDLIDA